MDQSETLRTIAEIGIALAGFTGVVAVLGRRSGGDWSPLEALRLHVLIQTSLLVVFLSFLPILLLRAASAETAWRTANGACGLALVVTTYVIVTRWRASGYSWEGASVRVARLLGAISTVALFLILLLQFAAALGFSLLDAFLVYALGLLYLLALGAMNFVFLLLPDKSGQ